MNLIFESYIHYTADYSLSNSINKYSTDQYAGLKSNFGRI